MTHGPLLGSGQWKFCSGCQASSAADTGVPLGCHQHMLSIDMHLHLKAQQCTSVQPNNTTHSAQQCGSSMSSLSRVNAASCLMFQLAVLSGTEGNLQVELASTAVKLPACRQAVASTISVLLGNKSLG